MADKSKSKKSKPKPKRDPNQPTPKPPKKRSPIPKLLLSATFVILATWMTMYSAQLGRGPWDWEGDDWSGFLTFSKGQVEAAKKKVAEVDWEKVKDKVTAKTKELWNKVPELEQKLEAKLDQLRGGKQKKVEGKGPQDGLPAAVVEPTTLERGCETFRMGIRHYKQSMDSQAELKKAKKLFLEARELLEKAYGEAEAEGDTAQATEIEGYIQQCQIYLEDCSKRETL